MEELTPRSQKIPIENSPFSSATHLNSLNFSIFTQKYYEIRSLKQNDPRTLARKQWLKVARNYLKVERNNILFNFVVAKKIHNSRKEILKSHFFSEWHNKFIERKHQEEEESSNVKQNEEINQITERAVESIDIENNLDNNENSAPVSPPLSPNSKKKVRKLYSDKSTDTIEIPKPTFSQKIKSCDFKTIILLIFIAIIACAGTYCGFHYYFKRNNFEQLYKKHKYEETLPPNDGEVDGDVVIDYNKVFPEEGDLINIMKNLKKKVKNIKNKQTELNEQVQNIQDSLADEEGKKNDEEQTIHESDYNKNENVKVESSENITSKEESTDQVN